MILQKTAFKKYMRIKEAPNDHEMGLFSRTHHYMPLIANIRGIQMVTVVNSLSMYTTHKDSDIDLCIVTKP